MSLPTAGGVEEKNKEVIDMKIESKSFEHEGMIPAKYSCDGDDINPHLSWSDAPDETRSFALSCVDPDAPGGDFIHWLIYNIPADVSEVKEGAGIPGGLEVKNHFGRKQYGGPCPPSGVHRYYFTVYALDTMITDELTMGDFRQKVGEHTIAKAVLLGRYIRR